MKNLLIVIFISFFFLLPINSFAKKTIVKDTARIMTNNGIIKPVEFLLELEIADSLDEGLVVKSWIKKIDSTAVKKIDWYLFAFNGGISLIHKSDKWEYYNTGYNNTEALKALDYKYWHNLARHLITKYVHNQTCFSDVNIIKNINGIFEPAKVKLKSSYDNNYIYFITKP